MRSRAESAPSDEEQLVLRLAGAQTRRSATQPAISRLAAVVDPDRLAATLNRHRLGCLGIARLRDLGQSDLAGRLEEILGERLRQTRMRSFIQETLTEGMLALLDEYDLPVVPLKGVKLSRRLYGDGAIREANDVDLLVLPEHLGRAAALTRARFGFEAPRDVVNRAGLPRLHLRLEHGRGAPPVELHWRVHWYEARSGPVMLRRSIGHGANIQLRAADEFATLLLFYARDGFVGIGPLATIASWWDRYGGELEPEALPAVATEFPELMPSLAQSAELAARLVGIPVPAWSWQRGNRRRARQSRAQRLVNWRRIGSYEQINAEAALVDVLLAPPGSGRESLKRRVSISGEPDPRQPADERPPWWRTRVDQVRRITSLVVRVSFAFLTSSMLGAREG
jgi:Uncharacterised nucleotidyltransferase